MGVVSDNRQTSCKPAFYLPVWKRTGRIGTGDGVHQDIPLISDLHVDVAVVLALHGKTKREWEAGWKVNREEAEDASSAV